MANAVTLRDVTADDLPILYEHQHDPEVTGMAAIPMREWDAFLTNWTKILSDDALGKQVILVDGQIVGSLMLFDHSGEREVGYLLGKAYWGKGIATQALAMFLRQIATRPLYARVAAHNLGSLRVLAKNGFTIVGEEREEAENLTIHILRLDAQGDNA